MRITSPSRAGYPDAPETTPGSSAEVEAARVEVVRVELVPELVERPPRVVCEQMLHDADPAVVVPGQVDVLARDEVHREPHARRAADGDADEAVAVARREQPERRREDGPRPLLRVAEEAPRPLARLDPPRGQVAELTVEPLEPRGHQVQEDTVLQPEGRPVEVVVRDEPDV